MKLITDLDQKRCRDIQLIASDFDGTLTEKGQLTSPVIDAISQLQTAGISVVIVTGRSAGWVNALRQYLPIAGAIAENGGLYYSHPDTFPEFLVSLPAISEHRRQLATCFQQLGLAWPQLQQSPDNPFRFTDWTFDVAGLCASDLDKLAAQCQQQGYSFTYSSVQCHIKPQGQDKAQGLQTVVNRYFPHLRPEQILTAGDSPNDESLFNPALFPLSVGVANIKDYRRQIKHPPQYVTQAGEGKGFSELAKHVIMHQ